MTVWKKGLNPWTEARVHLHCWLSASNGPRIYRRLFAGPLYGREAGVESQKMIWNWYKCVFLILSLTRLQWLLLLEVEVHIVLQQRWFIEVGIWYIYIYIHSQQILHIQPHNDLHPNKVQKLVCPTSCFIFWSTGSHSNIWTKRIP